MKCEVAARVAGSDHRAVPEPEEGADMLKASERLNVSIYIEG